MGHQRTQLIGIGLLIGIALAVPRQASALVGASFDNTQLSAITTHNTNGPTPTVGEDVTLDYSAGPWLKDIVNNSGSGFSSGEDRTITELLTNIGPLAWTGWHEQIVSRTEIFVEDDAPGFLFRDGSLDVQADYGSGMVPLAEGTDYTLVTTLYSGPPDPGNNFDFEAITILFEPHAQILAGDVLRIEKDIFEIFGDANIWRFEEAARIGEYPLPVPEPTCLVFPAVALLLRRRRNGISG